MSPNLFKVLLHMGAIVHALKDIETGVSDLFHGKPSLADLKSVASDLADILSDGIFGIPGMDEATLNSVISELKSLGA